MSKILGRFHCVKRFADLVEASTKTARLLLKQQSFYNRHFAVLVEASTKTMNLLTRWNLPILSKTQHCVKLKSVQNKIV